MFEKGTGDLLLSDSEALVNTVNTGGFMGGGLALQFKRKFPQICFAYEKACKNRSLKLGKVHVVELSPEYAPQRYVINFPTVDEFINSSKLSDIELGLNDLIKKVVLLNIKSISIPPLGCGIGGANWDDVKPLILKAFQDLPNVKVVIFEPQR